MPIEKKIERLFRKELWFKRYFSFSSNCINIQPSGTTAITIRGKNQIDKIQKVYAMKDKYSV